MGILVGQVWESPVSDDAFNAINGDIGPKRPGTPRTLIVAE
jgi:hypothetical protein